jgi:hypothetical protein
VLVNVQKERTNKKRLRQKQIGSIINEFYDVDFIAGAIFSNDILYII